MITVYTPAGDRLREGGPEDLAPAAVWVDLLEPTAEEERSVEDLFGIDVPTREEMQEIEASSRLYAVEGAVYATTPLVTDSDSARPQTSAVTFILTRQRVITVRYATPQAFATYAARMTRNRAQVAAADAVLAGLLEALIDRLADVLERVGADLDALSHRVFHPPEPQPGGLRRLIAGRAGEAPDFQEILRAVGRQGDLASRLRDSLLGLGRMLPYLTSAGEPLIRREMRQRFKTMAVDIRSLNDHASFLAGKVAFLLDATLGMISIQQNNIIKIFSVVAVIFLPPTLIASIYGMNFAFMPELDEPWGYPMALALMLASAIVPYLYFKRRGWL